MDLIFTNAKRVDQGVLTRHSFDLSYGAEENDFELSLGADEPTLETDACVYIEGTEYGGIVGGLKASTNGKTVRYMGRTWHGILNSKVIQPDPGEDYLVASGDAHTVLSFLISRYGLTGLFVVPEEPSGIHISSYKFNRYCKCYDGIMAMLATKDAKLKIAWKDRAVHLSAEPIVDYTHSPVDGDVATLTVEQNNQKVNHLICLGKGSLANREVIHLYVDQFGRIGDFQYYTGLDEIADTYDNSLSETLRVDGIRKLQELRDIDTADIDITEAEGLTYDIGDIVGASEMKSGIKVVETVTQKIIRINNGILRAEYKTGGHSVSSSDSSEGTDDPETDPEGGGSGGDYVLPIASQTTLGGIRVGSNLEISADGTLSVTTTNQAEQDNTKPITSAGVHTQLGNIEVLLAAL